MPQNSSSSTAPSWSDFLREADACAHGVQIYRDVDELAASLAAYLAAGFEAGEPGVIVATAEHLDRFAAHLGAAGWAADALRRDGLLLVEDAEATLDRILVDGRPQSAAFEAVVGGLLDALAERFPDRETRVFGEMVDLLCARGAAAAAICLEELWNSLARTRRFSLLCGYRADIFDRGLQVDLLPDVCRTHSHVLPSADPARFAVAVDDALEEVLGPAEAGKVYVLVGDQIRRDRVPVPELVLMWISANMPALADRVLASARERYVAAA